MRRYVFLALALLAVASAAAFIGQTPASAQPLSIQVVAGYGNTFQVSATFNSDEIPVSFSTSGGGIAVSVNLVSCSSAAGDCTARVPDTDSSPIAYNTGSAITGIDSDSNAQSVTIAVAFTLSCYAYGNVQVIAEQGGTTLTAPLNCGGYQSYQNSIPWAYPISVGPSYCGCSSFYQNPGFYQYPVSSYAYPAGLASFDTGLFVHDGRVFLAAPRPPHIGGGLGALVGGSGTKRNLARQRQAAEAAAAPSIQATIQQYLASVLGPVRLPNTGDAGLIGQIELPPTDQYLVYLDEVPEGEVLQPE